MSEPEQAAEGSEGFPRSSGRFEVVDYPGAGGAVLNAIDGFGLTIVGVFLDPKTNHVRSFMQAHFGKPTTIDPPGAVDTFAQGVNRFGFVVGDFVDAAGKRHGFRRTPHGRFQMVAVEGAAETFPNGIDDLGRIAGSFRKQAGGRLFGFVLSADGKKMTIVDVKGSTDTVAAGISNGGLVVGSASGGTAGGDEPFVLDLETGIIILVPCVPPLFPPDCNRKTAAIKVSSQKLPAALVGKSIRADGSEVGWVGDTTGAARLIDIPVPSTSNQALGISDTGDVVGGFTDPGGIQHGFRSRSASVSGSR